MVLLCLFLAETVFSNQEDLLVSFSPFLLLAPAFPHFLINPLEKVSDLMRNFAHGIFLVGLIAPYIGHF